MNAITPTVNKSATMPPTMPPINAEWLSSDEFEAGMATSVVAIVVTSSLMIVAIVLDSITVDNVDIPVIELACCIVVLVVGGIGVVGLVGLGGRHVRLGRHMGMQSDGAVEQSCWVDVNSDRNDLNRAHQAICIVVQFLQSADWN